MKYTVNNLYDGLEIYIPYKDKPRHWWLEKRNNSPVSDYWLCTRIVEDDREYIRRESSPVKTAEDVLFKINNGTWKVKSIWYEVYEQ